jgi:hypothetical protein
MRRTFRSVAAGALLAGLALSDTGCGATAPDSEGPVGRETSHIDFTNPNITKYIGGLGPVLEFAQDVGGIYTSFQNALYIAQKLNFFLGFGDDPDVNPMEALMEQQIQVILQQLQGVINLIVDTHWHDLEIEAEQKFEDAMYTSRRARDWANTNATPIPLYSSDWVTLDSLSYSAAQSFAGSVWYYWPYRPGVSKYSWAPEPDGKQIFDWRLGLPRFADAITARLNVLAVTRADFRSDPAVQTELLGYRDALKTIYDKIQSVAISCGPPPIPSYSQGDLSGVPIYCTSRVTGKQLQAGTIGHQVDTTPYIQQLMDDAGLAPMRGLMTRLYELAFDITGDNASNIARVDYVPVKGIGMCVEPQTIPGDVHSQLVMRSCANAPNAGRAWNVEYRAARTGGSDYVARLRYGNTGLCVNVPWASASVHNVLQLYPCSTDTPFSNEIFDHTTVGQLLYGGLCFNVTGGAAVDGATVQLYPCQGGSNEKWTLQ